MDERTERTQRNTTISSPALLLPPTSCSAKAPKSPLLYRCASVEGKQTTNNKQQTNQHQHQASVFIFLLLRLSLPPPPSVRPRFGDQSACFFSFLFTAISLSFSTRYGYMHGVQTYTPGMHMCVRGTRICAAPKEREKSYGRAHRPSDGRTDGRKVFVLWGQRRAGRDGRGGHSFVVCLSNLTIDNTSLSRRSTVDGRRGRAEWLWVSSNHSNDTFGPKRPPSHDASPY